MEILVIQLSDLQLMKRSEKWSGGFVGVLILSWTSLLEKIFMRQGSGLFETLQFQLEPFPFIRRLKRLKVLQKI